VAFSQACWSESDEPQYETWWNYITGKHCKARLPRHSNDLLEIFKSIASQRRDLIKGLNSLIELSRILKSSQKQACRVGDFLQSRKEEAIKSGDPCDSEDMNKYMTNLWRISDALINACFDIGVDIVLAEKTKKIMKEEFRRVEQAVQLLEKRNAGVKKGWRGMSKAMVVELEEVLL
jgi:hypothetical protein